MRDFKGKPASTNDQKAKAFFRLMAGPSEAIKEVHRSREGEPDWMPKEWTPEDDEAEDGASEGEDDDPA